MEAHGSNNSPSDLNSNSHTQLDFGNLSTKNDSVPVSTKELDLFNFGNSEGSSSLANNKEERRGNNTADTPFLCNFCKRGFKTGQALGGHQNAHKKEHAQAKYRQKRDAEVIGDKFPRYSYHNFFPKPFYGASNNRPLGVRMESKIHKPYNHSTPPGFMYGHGHVGGWSRQGTLNPSLDRLRLEGLQAQSGATLRLEGLQAESGATLRLKGLQAYGGVIGMQGSGATLRIDNGHGNVGPSTHVASKPEEEEPFNAKSPELDLSLRL